MTSPKFGHDMLQYFLLDPNYTNVNHGSFGSLPKPVFDACNELSLELESSPDRFLRLKYEPLLNDVRMQLAQLLGTDTDEIVLVPNVATGINTVLRNFEWSEGDVLLTTTTTFDSVSRAVKDISQRTPCPTVSTFLLLLPDSHANIVSKFREHMRALKDSLAPNAKIVAIIDSIASSPGVLFPWREMVQVAKEVGAFTMVDGAHSIGQEVDLELGKAAPDFWVSSLHKWLYAKRGCGVLYVPKRNQHIIKSALPTACNYLALTVNFIESPFVAEFLWFGAAEVTPALSVRAALDFRTSLGGEKKINDYCHTLAVAAGKVLATILGTQVMDSSVEGELIPNMVNVELPLSGDIKPSPVIAKMFVEKLLLEHKVYGGHFYHNGKWWTRASAQVYNELGDYEKLGEALVVVCKEIAGSQDVPLL
ncbi:pyridoxal phosphate-dependent transferase [Sparassis latifolia]